MRVSARSRCDRLMPCGQPRHILGQLATGQPSRSLRIAPASRAASAASASISSCPPARGRVCACSHSSRSIVLARVAVQPCLALDVAAPAARSGPLQRVDPGDSARASWSHESRHAATSAAAAPPPRSPLPRAGAARRLRRLRRGHGPRRGQRPRPDPGRHQPLAQRPLGQGARLVRLAPAAVEQHPFGMPQFLADLAIARRLPGLPRQRCQLLGQVVRPRRRRATGSSRSPEASVPPRAAAGKAPRSPPPLPGSGGASSAWR